VSRFAPAPPARVTRTDSEPTMDPAGAMYWTTVPRRRYADRGERCTVPADASGSPTATETATAPATSAALVLIRIHGLSEEATPRQSPGRVRPPSSVQRQHRRGRRALWARRRRSSQAGFDQITPYVLKAWRPASPR